MFMSTDLLTGLQAGTMFQLAEIRHMVRIPPWLFGQTLNDAVIEELNRKLANKVCCSVSVITF